MWSEKLNNRQSDGGMMGDVCYRICTKDRSFMTFTIQFLKLYRTLDVTLVKKTLDVTLVKKTLDVTLITKDVFEIEEL